MDKQSQANKDQSVSANVKKDHCCSTHKENGNKLKDSNPSKTFKEAGCGSDK